MAQSRSIRQYGLWDSPISPDRMASEIRLTDVGWGEDGSLVWLEQRSGRGVLVIQPPNQAAFRDVNSTFHVRARVGYGGGEFTVGPDAIFFVDGSSGRLFRQPLAAGVAQPITPAFGLAAAPVISPSGRWVLFVHTDEGQDVLAVVDAKGKHWPAKFSEGHDFYMQPGWSPDGSRLAWVAWDHPNMPWDGSLLQLAEVKEKGGRLPEAGAVQTIAGGENTSIFQPCFSPDGRLLAYASDANGWWQIYLYHLESGEHSLLTSDPSEHASPAWVQGLRSLQFSSDGKRLYFIRIRQGVTSLWQLDLATREERSLPLDPAYTWVSQIALSPDGEKIALIASGSTTPTQVITFDLSGKTEVRRRGTSEDLPQSAYAQAETITWLGMDGGTVYGFFYSPTSERFEGLGRPPLVVYIHGGPTSQVPADFDPEAQFFTSRGYAFLSVNHRGSTGYGRDYRNALRGNWGIYDVQDAVSGARSLAERGRVDGDRVIIMGGSAGGYTVLKALVDYPGFFKAGVCRYGVSNLFNLAADTHKFESHYCDSLLGPLPQASAVYRQRSPIFFADQITDPIILFQGEIDEVVPRDQSDTLVESLRRRGVTHEYHIYAGEGHGFRKQETIEHMYQAIERFLRQHVIFS